MRETMVLVLTAIALTETSVAGVHTESLAYSGLGSPVLAIVDGGVRVDPPNVATSGLSRASSAADLNLGFIRLRADSDADPYSYSYATATMTDRLTFSPQSYGQTATLYWLFNASLAPNFGFSNGSETRAGISVSVGTLADSYTITNGICDGARCSSFPGGTVLPFTVIGSMTWQIAAGPVDVYANMFAGAYGNSEWADASHTGLFYLELPAGVTFTSESGTFLAQATPIPEVSTGAMLALGLLIVLAIHRRLAALESLSARLAKPKLHGA